MKYLTGPRYAYLAGRFDRRDELIEHEAKLAEHNIRSNTRWLRVETDLRNPHTKEEIQQFAAMDVEDVINSDFLIAFSEDLTTNASVGVHSTQGGLYVPAVWARGGRHVEFGIALASGLDIVIIGPRENLFHHFPGDRITRYDTLEEFLSWYDANNKIPADAEA